MTLTRIDLVHMLQELSEHPTSSSKGRTLGQSAGQNWLVKMEWGRSVCKAAGGGMQVYQTCLGNCMPLHVCA